MTTALQTTSHVTISRALRKFRRKRSYKSAYETSLMLAHGIIGWKMTTAWSEAVRTRSNKKNRPKRWTHVLQSCRFVSEFRLVVLAGLLLLAFVLLLELRQLVFVLLLDLLAFRLQLLVLFVLQHQLLIVGRLCTRSEQSRLAIVSTNSYPALRSRHAKCIRKFDRVTDAQRCLVLAAITG